MSCISWLRKNLLGVVYAGIGLVVLFTSLTSLLVFSYSHSISSHAINRASIATKLLRDQKNQDYSVIPLIFVPNDQQTPSPEQMSKISQWISYVQAWYASRLDNKTFFCPPISVYKGNYSLAWYQQCRLQNCTSQITYYNVLSELRQADFPIGAPSSAKQVLLVFFQGETQDGSPALGGSEKANSNLTYFTLPFLETLYTVDPFSLNIQAVCPFTQPECSYFAKLGTIAHELAHSFGLSHLLPEAPPENVQGSIIDQVHSFPHNSFADNINNPEREKIQESPFIRHSLSPIPEPLSLLARLKYTLYPGWNLVSIGLFPVSYSEEGWTVYDFIFNSGGFDFCEKAHILSTKPVVGWKTYFCKVIEQPDMALSPGQGFWIKMKKGSEFTLHGLKFSDFPAVSLKQGWNLVGPPWLNFNRPLNEVFSENKKSIEAVYYYDPTDFQNPWKRYWFKLPRPALEIGRVETGRGYLIKTSADVLWTLDSSQAKTIILNPQEIGLPNPPSLPD